MPGMRQDRVFMSEEPLAETSGRIYAHSIRVDAACIDENRHANNVVYLQWMNEASLLHFETHVWDLTLMSALCERSKPITGIVR